MKLNRSTEKIAVWLIFFFSFFVFDVAWLASFRLWYHKVSLFSYLQILKNKKEPGQVSGALRRVANKKNYIQVRLIINNLKIGLKVLTDVLKKISSFQLLWSSSVVALQCGPSIFNFASLCIASDFDRVPKFWPFLLSFNFTHSSCTWLASLSLSLLLSVGRSSLDE